MADVTPALFKELPEFLEVDLAESLTARTETLASFRELGPPDLCHTIKGTGKSGQREVGSYHYVSGVDASSSASLAAYLNSLTYSIEDPGSWFKGNVWKVRSGCYCCFNAFSRVDVRVDVKIPGGVAAYIIDLRGERHEATPEIWQETYLSALLRAILYVDDPSYKLIGYRKLEPITTPEAELRFLQAAEALFVKGWQLGSDPEVQVACATANHLVTGLMKYFGDSFRFDKIANLYEKLRIREPDVAALLAKSYIGMNEEVKAVQIINSSLHSSAQPHYALLHVQCDFLRSKGEHDMALEVAKAAVNSAPSEFNTWSKLTEVYVELGMHEAALLTLNSCPMFTVNEKDLHRMPTPWKTHLPVKAFVEESGILDENVKDDETDIALQRLPAPSLKGTFAHAYSILAKLVSHIGWDELLKARSNVFVMEEEYRMQKAMGDIKAAMNEGDSGYGSQKKDDQTTDNASTHGIISPSSPRLKDSDDLDVPTSPGIPTIKVSSESDREREMAELNGTKETEVANENPVMRPERAVTPTEEDSQKTQEEKTAQSIVNGDGSASSLEDIGPAGFSFANKRLCERWLDNLFMCLYEDLRIWTIFRAEVAHFKTQHLAYRKNPSEWEILGELGLRLHHKEEAKDAFQRCLDGRFSAKAWSRLLEMWSEEGDLAKSLNAAVRLTVYNQRWYMETAYPTTVANHMYKLGQIHGHAKISYTLLSMGLPEPIQKAMEAYLRYGSAFKVEGSEF